MGQANKLTEGNINRQLISLAIPLIIGNIFQQFYNTIDAFVVGRYIGQAAFAAIGISGSVMNLFIFILTGCCIGISIIFAQFYGKNDLSGFRNEFFIALIFGSIFTIIISLLGIIFIGPILRFMKTPAEAEVLSTIYLTIIFIGLIATYLYNLCTSLLRAVGDTTASLVILIISVLMNLILDILFVSTFSMGIGGAAWATVIAQLISVVASFVYIKKKYPHLLFTKEDMKINITLLKRTFSYGMVSALQQSSLYIGKLLVQVSVNTLGLEMIAAYTAATRIEGFANSFGDSGANAISVFVAQNVGNENHKRAKQGFNSGLKILIIFGIGLSLFMFATARLTVGFVLGDSTQNELISAVKYLKVISIFYTLNYIGSAFVGCFRGNGNVHIPVIGTTIHISIRVILSFILADKLGLNAVAIATGIGWIVVVTFHSFKYKKHFKK